MRTGRSLTVCWRLLPGGCLLRGVSLPGGSGPGGCLLWGVLPVWGGVLPAPGGSPFPGGVLPARGVFSLPGGSPCLGGFFLPRERGGSPCLETPPPVNRITDTCKNITLAPTSLRPVITVANLKSRKGTVILVHYRKKTYLRFLSSPFTTNMSDSFSEFTCGKISEKMVTVCKDSL